MVAEDDSGVNDNEQLYRRVLHRIKDFLVYDDNLDRWTPGNAALAFDPDLSIYLASKMTSLGLPIDSILEYPKAAVVFAIRTGDVRAEKFDVQATPVMHTGSSLDLAHGSIVADPEWDKNEFRERRNEIRRRFKHVAGTITASAGNNG